MLAWGRDGHLLISTGQGIIEGWNYPHRHVRIGFHQAPDGFRSRECDDGFKVAKARDDLAIMRKEAHAPFIVVAEPAAGAEEIDVAVFHPLVAEGFYPRCGLAPGGIDDEEIRLHDAGFIASCVP